jgi:hypothetical protein
MLSMRRRGPGSAGVVGLVVFGGQFGEILGGFVEHDLVVDIAAVL